MSLKSKEVHLNDGNLSDCFSGPILISPPTFSTLIPMLPQKSIQISENKSQSIIHQIFCWMKRMSIPSNSSEEGAVQGLDFLNQ